MHAETPATRRGWLAALIIAAISVTAVGCTPGTSLPTPSGSATPRPFTVMVTGAITTADPAVAVGTADSMLVTSVYQRLMQVAPGSGDLKPDAATDCAFTSRLVYACTLPNSLYFQNGDPMIATDVRFSIQRALRLDGAGTSIGLLSSLRRIDTPDDRTVRFVLSREDNQFGYALAGQATSIVNHRLYDPDSDLALDTLPVGSGPFSVTKISDSEAILQKYDRYVGPTTAQLDRIRVQVAADSVAAEAAINAGSVDVAWSCLDSAAEQRIDNEISAGGGATASGFTRVNLSGVKVTRLHWNPESKLRKKKKLRDGVAKALQGDRSMDSVVPLGVTDRAKSFAVGGRVKLPKLKGRTNMTLGYDPADPAQANVARMLRDRIEQLDGLSLRVTTSGKADLLLTSQPAWINNALGWLQLYLGAPLGSSKTKLTDLEAHARATSGASRTADLSELQQQAAADNTVLPVSQSTALLLLGPGVKMAAGSFGSGQQLGLWGLSLG